MVKVIIGSMVLCHLLVPGPAVTTSETGPAVTKILGEIMDMQKGSRYIENPETKQALRVDTDILIIKGKNKEGIYQVDSRACMLVRDETPEEKENRVNPKIKVEEPVKEEKEEEADKNPADMEIQDRPTVDEAKVERKLEKLPELTPEEKIEVKEELKEVKEELKVEPEVKKAEPVKEDSKKAEKANKSLLDYIK